MENEENATRRPQQPAQDQSASNGAHGPLPATPSTTNPYSPTSSSHTAFRSPSTTATGLVAAAGNVPHAATSVQHGSSKSDGLSAVPSSATANNTITRQRSSIACLHCRKSKIRCVNDGIDTPCNACRHAGRECKYSVEMFKRSRIGEEDPEKQSTSKRNKSRKSESNPADSGLRILKLESGAAGGLRSSTGMREDAPNLISDGVLDPNLLTPQVWAEIYTIFETNYGTDFPFLHSPTFSKRLREAPDLHPANATIQERRKAYEPERIPGWELLILGILALTARFHPRLVDVLCSDKGKTKAPVYASEHFATVLRSMLVGSGGTYIGIPNIAKIQALLMLGMYEWSSCKGGKAWIHVGIAIRMAQAVGLQFEDDHDFQPMALSSATRIDALHLELGDPTASGEPLNPNSGHAFIEEEMRRRTFWSCFIMDRYLSSGKFRPSMLMLYDIRLQLPCSQNAFLFGDRVCTDYIDGTCSKAGERLRRKVRDYRRWMQRNKGLSGDLGSASDAASNGGYRPAADVDLQVPCEKGLTESVLSVHIRMVEIWGRVAKWACAGGIRSETYSPWHPSSDFHRLRESLSRFQEALPRLLRFSKTNIDAHIAQRTTDAYLLVQILFSLSVIVLHRELLPFVPIRCTSPSGPIDLSHLPQEPPVPQGFFIESARQLFGASRDILELVQAIHSRCSLPETPVSGFSLYIMAFTATYALHFPHMDPDHILTAGGYENTVKFVSTVLQTIAQMRRRLRMADNWFRTIHRLHRYYYKITSEATLCLQHNTVPSGVFVHHLPRPEGLNALQAMLARLGSSQDNDVDSWSGSRHNIGWTGPSSADEPVKRGNQFEPVNAASSAPDQGLRSSASHQRVRSEASPYGTASPYPVNQPPGLSRGSTPTPSLSSTSPHSGPARPHGDADRSHPHTPLIHQQLAYAAGSASQPDWQIVYGQPQSRFNQLSLSTHVQGSAPLQPGTAAPEASRPQSLFWLSDLQKTMGGDDVAAFMDGMNCQEWDESPGVAHSTWDVKGGGWRGLLDGEERGWMGRIWRGSASTA